MKKQAWLDRWSQFNNLCLIRSVCYLLEKFNLWWSNVGSTPLIYSILSVDDNVMQSNPMLGVDTKRSQLAKAQHVSLPDCNSFVCCWLNCWDMFMYITQNQLCQQGLSSRWQNVFIHSGLLRWLLLKLDARAIHVRHCLNILNGSVVVQLLDSWTNTSSSIKLVDGHAATVLQFACEDAAGSPSTKPSQIHSKATKTKLY